MERAMSLKTKISRVIIIFFLLFLSPVRVFPCSAFADFSKDPIYGFNFDSMDFDLRFMFYKGRGSDIFAFEFFQDNNWVRMTHMTSDGLFTSGGLLLFPSRAVVSGSSENDLALWKTTYWVYDSSTLDDIVTRLSGVRLVDDGIRCHNMFADPSGAVTVEATVDGNYVKHAPRGGYAVLTNFALAQFEGKDMENMYGLGDNRYRTAVREIEALRNSGSMSVDEGMKILRAVKQDAGDWKTRCSLVLNPMDLTIRIALQRNWEKTYTFSLKDRTVKADWEGAGGHTAKIGKKGVTAAELASWQNDDPADDWKGSSDTLPIVAGILFTFAAAGGLSFITFRKLRSGRK